MIAQKPESVFWMIGASALTATCVTWLMQPSFSQIRSFSQATSTGQNAEPLTQPRQITSRTDQMRVLSAITSKIAYMMTADPAVKCKVWPDIATESIGRHGIIIACSRSLYLDSNEPGMDVRKSWVMLAVLACVKYTEGSPVTVDYIGFTDPEGLSGERWYYELKMSTAENVHHQIRRGTITMQDGYDQVASAWQRVTSSSAQ